jgi:hypothetical protein
MQLQFKITLYVLILTVSIELINSATTTFYCQTNKNNNVNNGNNMITLTDNVTPIRKINVFRNCGSVKECNNCNNNCTSTTNKKSKKYCNDCGLCTTTNNSNGNKGNNSGNNGNSNSRNNNYEIYFPNSANNMIVIVISTGINSEIRCYKINPLNQTNYVLNNASC